MKKNIFLIIILELILLLSFFVLNSGYDYFVLKKQSGVISEFLRDDFLIDDFRSLNKKIELAKKTFDISDIIVSTEHNRQAQLLEVVLPIYSNQKMKSGIIGRMYFGQSILKSFFQSFAFWLFINFVLILSSPFIKSHLNKLVMEKVRKENELLLGRISKQVAHDIRSPLGTLNMLVSEKIDIPSEYKDLMKNVTLRINSIADDLLTKSKALGQSEISTVVDLQKGQSTLASSVNVFDAISEVITEKRILFPDFVFEIRNSATLFDITCDASELKRLMSNLINNAVEASVENKTVYISLLNQQNSLNVTIIDFGTGISEENITKIGLKQFTTKGSNGNGIGLHHAFHKMQEWGGKLSVQSKVGVGTQVELSWPLQS